MGPNSIAELAAEVGSANSGDVVPEEGMQARLHQPLTKLPCARCSIAV